jgi:acetyl-CoA carboxylase carboxyl transferase subunit alpha
LDSLASEQQIHDIIQAIERLKRQEIDSTVFHTEIEKLEQRLEQLKESVYKKMTPWERVQICRHPKRPHTSDYIEHICDHFQELAGDRTYRDDKAIIGGLATIGNTRCVIIGQEKGHDTATRVEHNFGMLHPEGYRKALRLMHLAEKFQLPLVSLIDTPGAYPALEAEERGQGRAIALNIMEMARLETPIVVVVIGEGCSGGALGIGIGDVIGMLEHAYYSVISPEGCASILWKESSKKDEAAKALKLNAEDLLKQGVIDHIISEPIGGAHKDPQIVYTSVKNYIISQIDLLKTSSTQALVRQRYNKFRKIGAHTRLSS